MSSFLLEPEDVYTSKPHYFDETGKLGGCGDNDANELKLLLNKPETKQACADMLRSKGVAFADVKPELQVSLSKLCPDRFEYAVACKPVEAVEGFGGGRKGQCRCGCAQGTTHAFLMMLLAVGIAFLLVRYVK
jgi:hypothetical protein